jgi:hypothetical protein
MYIDTVPNRNSAPAILKALQVPLPGQSLELDACYPLSLGKLFKRK